MNGAILNLRLHMSLQKRVKIVALLILLLFGAVSLYCGVTLVQLSGSFEQLFGASYMQTDILNKMDGLNRAVVQYGQYPNPNEHAELWNAYGQINSEIAELSAGAAERTFDDRRLIHAISQTYLSYGENLGRLMERNTGEISQDFYIQLSTTQEIGDYVTSYLKELTQQVLSSGYAEYQTQSRYLRLAPVILIFLVMLTILLVIGIDRWVYQYIVSPILLLARMAQDLVERQMDVPDVNIQQRDEVGYLARAFNRMKNDCRSLWLTQREKEELALNLYHEQLQRSEAEQNLSAARFSMLKQQINPHFLFNALTLVSQTARQETAQQTAQLIRQLSLLLRHNLHQNADWISIRQELDVLHSYMYIQQSRFRDRLLFWVDCRVVPEQYLIPSFLLQPLVENAVSHGIAPKESGGIVRVRIIEKRGRLVIFITDTGVGIKPEVLQALRDGNYHPQQEDSGIGVKNVAKRLEILQPDSKFRVFSVRNMGTCIRLELDCILSGTRLEQDLDLQDSPQIAVD